MFLYATTFLATLITYTNQLLHLHINLILLAFKCSKTCHLLPLPQHDAAMHTTVGGNSMSSVAHAPQGNSYLSARQSPPVLFPDVAASGFSITAVFVLQQGSLRPPQTPFPRKASPANCILMYTSQNRTSTHFCVCQLLCNDLKMQWSYLHRSGYACSGD